MPNYRVFQDVPENLRVKLYASQSGTATALQMDSGALVVTQDISTIDSGTTATFVSGANSGTTIWPVLDYSTWTYAINKVSGSGTTQVKLEVSATGTAGDWFDENGAFATIASGEWKYLVADTFLKYARIAVTVSGGVDGTVNWYFQGRKQS